MCKHQFDMSKNYNKVWQKEGWIDMPPKHYHGGTN